MKRSKSPSNLFMISQDKARPGESCPVCGSKMTYKDRVESWYCPKCKNFY